MDFPVIIDKNSHEPMWEQLFVGLRDAIVEGRMPHGYPLPSTRQLADMLSVSRDTILRCYEQLACLGYVKSKVGTGTVVTWKAKTQPELKELNCRPEQIIEQHLSPYGQRLMASAFGSNNLELLNYAAAPQDQLPLSSWRRASLQRNSAEPVISDLGFLSEPYGHHSLREAIAAYLQRSKGIDCHPDQVLVTADASQSQDLLARMLLNPEDMVVMENPACSRLRALLLSYGARLHAIPVDRDGIVTDALPDLPGSCKFAYVAPSHHDPTGFTMSLDRRRKLLAWAEKNSVFVIEDAQDSDYRYGSQPIPSLKRMDNNEQVVYLYSFWKTLFPLTGMSCLVLPTTLVDAFQRAAHLYRYSVPVAEANALAELLDGGHFERHLRRTWTEYTKRRQALIFALAQSFKSSVTYFTESAGMHLLVRFSAIATEEQLLVSAAQAGLPMVSTHDWYIDRAEPREFLIPFALLPAAQVADRVRTFAETLGLPAQSVQTSVRNHASLVHSPGPDSDGFGAGSLLGSDAAFR